jgi:hypothetical protein
MRIIFLLSFLLWTNTFFAQKNKVESPYSVDWTTPQKLNSKMDYQRIEFEYKNTAYALKSETQKRMGKFFNILTALEIIDIENNEVIGQIDLCGEKGDDAELVDAELVEKFLLGNQIFSFFSIDDSKTKEKQLLMKVFPADGKSEGILYQISDKKNVSRRFQGFQVFVSADSASFVIYENIPGDKKNNENNLEFTIVNTKGEILDRDIITLDNYKDRRFELISVHYSPKQNKLMLLARVYNKEDKMTVARVFIKKIGGKLNEFDLEPEKKKRLGSVRASLNDETGIATCFGYQRGSSGIESMVYFDLDIQTENITRQFTLKLENELMNQINGTKEGKNAKGVSEIVIRSVFRDKSGTIVIIGEQHYVVQVCTTNQNGVTTCRYNYYFNNIIATGISNGKIDWVSVVPKRQMSVNFIHPALSIKSFHDKDYVYILYNDNIRNMDLPFNKMKTFYGKTKGAHTVIVKLDKNSGKIMSKETLIDLSTEKDKDLKRLLISMQKIAVSPDRKILIIATGAGNTVKFGSIKI